MKYIQMIPISSLPKLLGARTTKVSICRYNQLKEIAITVYEINLSQEGNVQWYCSILYWTPNTLVILALVSTLLCSYLGSKDLRWAGNVS